MCVARPHADILLAFLLSQSTKIIEFSLPCKVRNNSNIDIRSIVSYLKVKNNVTFRQLLRIDLTEGI